MKLRIAVATLSFLCLVTATALARPPACHKWVNDLTCADVGTQCATDAQWKYYYDRVYADEGSPRDACVQFYKVVQPNLPPSQIGYYIAPNDPNLAICTVNGNQGTNIELAELTPEPMCFLTPDGPWTRFGRGGEPGADFTVWQKKTVLMSKKHLDGAVLSDYAGDYYQELSVAMGPVPNQAQADHIIPRVDIQGCECGPNSFANMLYISRQLNGQMSNYGDHPARLDILHQFTREHP